MGRRRAEEQPICQVPGTSPLVEERAAAAGAAGMAPAFAIRAQCTGVSTRTCAAPLAGVA
eukprot:1785011-Prorocentrum_lima.AAC.1